MKVAVIIYPHFSLQEITTLTSCLKIWFGVEIDFLGTALTTYPSEEGFQVLPTKKISDVTADDYACVILPGIINPLPALYDNVLIDFLASLKHKDILIAAISSSPLLLAKSGLLDDVKFTAGFFMQMTEVFPYINKANFIHQPVVEDEKIITAIGFAFREFAQTVLSHLGLDTGDSFMLPITREYEEDELTFYWEEADYKQFLEELSTYEK